LIDMKRKVYSSRYCTFDFPDITSPISVILLTNQCLIGFLKSWEDYFMVDSCIIAKMFYTDAITSSC